MEIPGFDGHGGPCYIGTGCFHRRDTLCGQKYSKEYKADLKGGNDRKVEDSASVLEETCKVLASCTYENNTQWGKEVSLYTYENNTPIINSDKCYLLGGYTTDIQLR